MRRNSRNIVGGSRKERRCMSTGRGGLSEGGVMDGAALPALNSTITRHTLQQLLVTTEILVPPMPQVREQSWQKGRGQRQLGSGVFNLKNGFKKQKMPVCKSDTDNGGNNDCNENKDTPTTYPTLDFRPRMRPITVAKKYGAIPAPVGDGTSPWDHSQLLHRRRQRLNHARRFHKKRRAEFACAVLKCCRKLRATHKPSPPDLATTLTARLPSTLKTKYDRILRELFQELQQCEVQPVHIKPLGSWQRYDVVGVQRVPWVGREKRALSRAMASFPPTVRTVMAQALRPLDSLTLVDVNDGGGGVGVGEGVELSVLITRWRAAARSGRAYLRNTWLPQSLSLIREAALETNLSPSRRHTVMHAFNNLLASKLQEVLIRSIESVLAWLGGDEEPWVGPRVKLHLVLEENQVVLNPDQEALITAFTDLFKELDECVQLYRGTWDEPQPPKVPRWRVRAAEVQHGDDEEVPPPLRPLEPRRETLVVTLSEPQWDTFYTTLANIISQRFTKAAEFLDQISKEWWKVLSGEVRKEVDEFLQQDAQLEEYAGQVLHYSSYVEQASLVPTSALLHVFRLEYNYLRQSLLSVSSCFVSMLRDRLIADHRDTIQGLNNQYETIHQRIQETPKSTEQLFRLMEYVEDVRRIIIHRLADDVVAMIVKLKIILDVVHLTPEDLVLTASIIVWPAKLKPFVDRAVESLEDFKQEFEETLVERSGEVNHTLDRIHQLVTELEELSDVAQVNKYIREVRKLESRLEKVSTLVAWVNQEESLFKFQLSSFPLLAELKECLVPYDELFTLVMKWRKYEKYWMDGDFTSLDPDFIDVETEELARELFRLRKAFKTKFKQQALEGDPRKARMNLDDPNPNNLPGPLRVCALALSQIKNFKEHLPLVAVLCNKGLRPRHWQNLNKAAGFDITPNAGTSLRKVVQMQLGGLLKEFEVVSSGASREYSLELSLGNMRSAWQTAHLTKALHPDAGVEVIVGLPDVRSLVYDHLITTHTIKNSPFVGPFRDDVKEWEGIMRTVQETFSIWYKVQTLWVDLTPVFSTPDLPLQLPQEHKLFLDVDRKWRSVMEAAISAEKLLDVAGDSTSLANVATCLQNFTVIQKAVHTYLDNKRQVFPRLYFLSNEELTGLLCEKDVAELEQHLRKCFDGIYSLHLDDECNIYAVASKEGEVVPLVKKLPALHACQSIENWLLQFQEAMTYTLKTKMCAGADWWTRKGGGRGSGREIDALVPPWPLQVTLTLRQVFWTAEVHQAICGGSQALQECLARLQSEVNSAVSLLRKSNTDTSRRQSFHIEGAIPTSDSSTPATSRTPASKTSISKTPVSSRTSVSKTPISSRTPSSRAPTSSRTPSSRAQTSSRKSTSIPDRRILSTLILVAVYARDVVAEMIEHKVTDVEAFTWLSQLRSYLNEDEVEVKMLYCTLPWGWEYVGAAGRLVVTPLTTRAHHSLVTAYHSHLGGALEGPAGTGKTETVKDLARSLALNCLVFNCSDDLDFISLGKFFTGVAASGSWACFDEFNRLEIGVLSVAAQQILSLVSARRETRDTFSLEGSRPLTLDPRGFIAVTMNPRYRGRVALPDNLKLLLRPVSMMVADYHSIVEVWLCAYGFMESYVLAACIVHVMKNASLMLHPHHHYDFGMRAVKTVLTTTERLYITHPEWSETEVVLRALREVNHPKLVADDYLKFEDILTDFFLELPPTPRPPNDKLTESIEKVCEEDGLLLSDEFMAKLLQVHETMRERHGIMLVGPPCTAKTTIIKTLAKSLSHLDSNRPINIEIMNPKTVTAAQLIGSLNQLSREWSDGLVAKVIRQGRNVRQWIVLDGPTDASWVENLNTALDDSRKLCLPSGETLPLAVDMAIIFEVLDLSQASPATVSRCGMVYVGQSSVSWPALLHLWIHNNSSHTWWSQYGELLRDLANWLIPPTLAFVKQHCSFLLPITDISLVRSTFPLTATIIDDILQEPSLSQKDSAKLGPTWTTAAFCFSLTWSIAGAITPQSKEVFNEFYRRLVMGYLSEYPTPSSIGQIGCPYPVEGSVFDVMFDPKQRSFWRPWTDIIKHAEIPETTKISTLLIPTIESARLGYLVGICGRGTGAVLVVGEGQSGRQITIQHYLKQQSTSHIDALKLPVTPAATAHTLKSVVSQRLEQRNNGRWGGKGGRRVIALIDDLHLAVSDQYHARPLHEALREAISHKVWVKTDDTTRLPLEDITWLGGISLSGIRTNGAMKENERVGLLEPRCLASFMVLAAHSLTDDTINRIFTTQLNVFLRSGGFIPDMFTVVAGVVNGTLEILQHVTSSLIPSPSTAHYTFNLATAARVIHSVSFLRKEVMETKRHFIRLWVHEIYREFCDQLISDCEVTPIYNIIVSTIRANFRDKIHVIFDKLCNEDGSVTEACIQRACWGMMGSVDITPEERRYEELFDATQIHQTITAFIQDHNSSTTNPMNLVTFKYMVEHISHICRVVGRPGGHLLLVGMGGSGRRSLTRLAAHICGHVLACPRINPQDDYGDIMKVMKDAVIRAGVEEKATVVILSDAVCNHPSILHLINTIILTGDAPNLLPPEDHSYLMERLRLFMEDRKVEEAELWKEQVQRVKNLVHIVVTCPPAHNIGHIITHFPAFSTHVTIDYFKPWPQEALVKVGEHYLSEVPLRRSIRDAVISCATSAHQSARQMADKLTSTGKWCPPVTPTSYLHLLQEFRGLFTTRQAKTSSLKKKYLSGLDKLAFAASQISVMQEMLASLGPQIEEAAQDVSKMMELIEQESREVEARRQLVAKEEAEAEVHASHARVLQEECQVELNRALPALHEAVEALNTLKPADITVVKSMKNPPHAIKLVMAAVCVMLEIKPDRQKGSSVKATFDYWGPSKRLLGDMSFLQQLRDYDKDNIPDTVMDKINKEYVRLPEFDPTSVAKASSAAEGLCKWVRAMSSYNAIAKIVAPKRERLAEAESEVAVLMSVVEQKRGQLRELEEKLETLQRRFSLSCREKENLEAEQKLCSLKLHRAKKLISGLGGEQTRWEAAAETANRDLVRLPGDTLLASASLAYLPPYVPEVRNELLCEWSKAVKKMELEVTEPFNLVATLTPPLHIRAWGLEGLPTDAFSLQNATIIKHTVKWPLLVDPDNQGTNWLQQHEAPNNLEVVWEQDFDKLSPRASGGAPVSVLEDALTRCIPRGRPLLLLDLSGDPPLILSNVITRTVTEEGGMQVVSVGGLTLQFNSKFRLYLATRQPRPHISLETVASLTVVNFTVTVEGLHDHLRQILVKKERPELEDERQKLVLTTSSHQRALQETEECILHTLSSVQGNILESEEAILILQETKQMSNEIKRKQEQCLETEAVLLECCSQYEAVSKPAASLYITLASLSSVSHMYQFSLGWYINLYISVIESTGKSSVMSRRLSLLQESLVSRVHEAVQRGLATSHRIPFALLITLHVLRVKGEVKQEEEALLYHLVSHSGTDTPSLPTWLHPIMASAWPVLHLILPLPTFQGLEKSLSNETDTWVNLMTSTLPERSLLPSPWNTLPYIPWLILMAALRKDKVTWAVKFIITEVMGPQFLSPPVMDIAKYLDTPVSKKPGTRTPVSAKPVTPLLLVTAQGIDPLEEILLLAGKKPEINLTIVSLGQGQSSVAESAVVNGGKEGGWVILQNLHHAVTWLPTLANLITRLFTKTQGRNNNNTISPFLRLILTTEPTDEFPVSLLRGVEKMFIDNPGDAQQALQEATNALTRYTSHLQFTDEEEEEEIATCRLLHGLSVFHTVVSERRRHGHLAWSYPPAFTMADFTLTISAVTASLEVNGEINPEEVEYLVSKVFYGGRVHRKEDQEIITSILKQVMTLSLYQPEENEGSIDVSQETHQSHTTGEEVDDVGLSLLFPDYYGKLEDLQDFVKGVGGLEKPQVFGLPAGVQHLQEMESGHKFLTTLATIGGAQTAGTTGNVTQELQAYIKKIPVKIKGVDELSLCEDNDLAELLRREIKLLNSTLDTITESLNSAIQLSTGAVSWSSRSEEIIAEIMIGRTPLHWLNLYSNPAPPQLHHFIEDLYTKTNFFKSWMKNGCPTQFWLGSFHFLPAFLVTLLRKAARHSNRPLHHYTWSFRFTDIPLDTEAIIYFIDKTESEENENENVPSDMKTLCKENDGDTVVENHGELCRESEKNERNEENSEQNERNEENSEQNERNEENSEQNERNGESIEENERKGERSEQNERNEENSEKNEINEENGEQNEGIEESNEQELTKCDKREQHNELGLNTEKSKQIWNEIGQKGLLVSGLWLFGASWNFIRCELEEPSSLELMEQLPVLSMIPKCGISESSYLHRESFDQQECSPDRKETALNSTQRKETDQNSTQNLSNSEETAQNSTQKKESTQNPNNRKETALNSTQRKETAQNSTQNLSTEFSAQNKDSFPQPSDENSNKSETINSNSNDCEYYECPVYEGGPAISSKLPVLTIPLRAGSKGINYWTQRRVAIYLSKN